VQRGVAAVAQALPVARRTQSFPNRAARWLKRVSEDPQRRYARRIVHFDPELRQEISTSAFLEAVHDRRPFGRLLDAYRVSDAPDEIDGALDVDVNTYLPDCLLVKVDIASMAHGLEARSPMIDHEFMEFAASLPSNMKIRGTLTKYILKRAAMPHLPADNIDRAKRGFSIPLAPWFRNEFGDLAADVLLDGRMAERGYFRMDVVRRLLDEHRRGLNMWQKQLWNLLMLEYWHRMFIDQRPAVAPAAMPVTVAAVHRDAETAAGCAR
jgi:asparagine synthase (glutamine-hydrolysing)